MREMVCAAVRPRLEDVAPKARALGLDGDMWSIVTKCWDQDSSQRYFAAELCERLNVLRHWSLQPAVAFDAPRMFQVPGTPYELTPSTSVSAPQPPATSREEYTLVSSSPRLHVCVQTAHTEPVEDADHEKVAHVPPYKPKQKDPSTYLPILESLIRTQSYPHAIASSVHNDGEHDLLFVECAEVVASPSYPTIQRPLSPKSLVQFVDTTAQPVSPLELRPIVGLPEPEHLSSQNPFASSPHSKLFAEPGAASLRTDDEAYIGRDTEFPALSREKSSDTFASPPLEQWSGSEALLIPDLGHDYDYWNSGESADPPKTPFSPS